MPQCCNVPRSGCGHHMATMRWQDRVRCMLVGTSIWRLRATTRLLGARASGTPGAATTGDDEVGWLGFIVGKAKSSTIDPTA